MITLLRYTRLKDCDATWLYGPLETSSCTFIVPSSSSPRIGPSKSCFLINKRSILKKRNAFNLLSPKLLSQGDGLGSSSIPSLEEQSPETNEKRHIHFDDKVEQFTAVMDARGDDDDQHRREGYSPYDTDDSSLDDGLMMKRLSWPNCPKESSQSSSCNSTSAGIKSIELLPPTTLKYQEHAIELDDPATDQAREILLPSQPSLKMILDIDDEDADISWEPPSVIANYEAATSVTHGTLQHNALSERNRCNEHSNVLCTSSSMFIPYKEDEDGMKAVGLFDQMVDSMNIIKDILYIIWTV